MGVFERIRPSKRTEPSAHPSVVEATDQEALRLIDEGNAFEGRGRIDQAAQCYEAAIRLAPKLARAHINRGNVLLERGDTAGALAGQRPSAYAAASTGCAGGGDRTAGSAPDQ